MRSSLLSNRWKAWSSPGGETMWSASAALPAHILRGGAHNSAWLWTAKAEERKKSYSLDAETHLSLFLFHSSPSRLFSRVFRLQCSVLDWRKEILSMGKCTSYCTANSRLIFHLSTPINMILVTAWVVGFDLNSSPLLNQALPSVPWDTSCLKCCLQICMASHYLV